MTLLGIRLTLMAGPTVALPVSPDVILAVRSVEVVHKDEGQSGFSVTFHIGRGGPLDALDYALVANPVLKPFNRMVVIVTVGVVPTVLMDGIIVEQEVAPGHEPGTGTMTLRGLDVSVAMDREERIVEHPAQDETIIATKLIASYAQYGIVPIVIPPLAIDPPIPIERTPVQRGTDLRYLRDMAARYGYVFYVSPGPAPLTNTAYWGPPIRPGLPQRAISVNLGPETNATLDQARNNAASAAKVTGNVQDRTTNQAAPVTSVAPLRPSLAAQPDWLTNMSSSRSWRIDTSGLNVAQAMARAQGAMEATIDTVKLEGSLDGGAYGGILQSRGLVGVRGAGFANDGIYYVKQVTHKLEPGTYSQRFLLTREGTGSTTPLVMT